MTDRDLTFDVLKGFLIITVILGHAISNLSGDPWHDKIFNFIYLFHMPLFIFISGYFSTSIGKYSLRDFLKRRTKRIMVPYVTYTIIGVIYGIDHFRSLFINPESSISDWCRLVFMNLVGNWYLLCVFILTLSFYPLVKWLYSKKKPDLIVFLGIITIWILLFNLCRYHIFESIERIQLVRHFPVFGSGLLWHYWILKKKPQHIGVAFLVLSFIVLLINIHINGIWVVDYNITCRILSNLCFVALLYPLLTKIAWVIKQYTTLIKSGLSYIGYNSLGFYLIHGFFIKTVAYWMPSSLNIYISSIVCTFICMFICMAIIELIKLIFKENSYLFGI